MLLLPCVALFGRHSVQGVVGIALAFSLTQYVVVVARLAPAAPRPYDCGRATCSVSRPALAVVCAAAAAAMLGLLAVLDLPAADRGRLLVGTVAVGLVGAGGDGCSPGSPVRPRRPLATHC